MLHYHPLTNEQGIITNRQLSAEGVFGSLNFNGTRHYFPKGCGVEVIDSDITRELFTFEMLIRLPEYPEARIYKFCAPPVPLNANHILMFNSGRYACCPFVYTNRTSKEVFFIKDDDGSHYLIPLPCYNDVVNRMDKGIMYRFEEKEILDEWNRRIAMHLERIPGDFFAMQAGVEVEPNRNGDFPFHYSPLVIPVFPPVRDSNQ